MRKTVTPKPAPRLNKKNPFLAHVYTIKRVLPFYDL